MYDYNTQAMVSSSGAAALDLFKVEARSWEKFEIRWKMRSPDTPERYNYHLEWRHKGSSPGNSSRGDSVLVSSDSDKVVKEKDDEDKETGVLKYIQPVPAWSKRTNGGRIEVMITVLSRKNEDPTPRDCPNIGCCCSPCNAVPSAGGSHPPRVSSASHFFRCFPREKLVGIKDDHIADRVCYQVMSRGDDGQVDDNRCTTGARKEVSLHPPPDSRGLNISNQRDNLICVQWRPPDNIISAEFQFRNYKGLWTSLFREDFSQVELKKYQALPYIRCEKAEERIKLSHVTSKQAQNQTVSKSITVQLQVVYAGRKNNKYNYQIQKPFTTYPPEAPPEAYPTVFIASLAAVFAVLLLFLAVFLLYRRLVPTKHGTSRILHHDSLSGSVGGVSTLRPDTPVNSGGTERMELMATLSRISHMPIHNSFMPVDNPLYLDHTSELPSDEDLKSLPHFPRASLSLVHYLGSGAFGNVYAGEARDIHGPGTGTVTVAVKTLQPNASGPSKKWSRGGGSLIWGRDQCNLDTNGANLIRRQMEQEPMQQQFLAEALLMAQFHHEHILPLIGVCLDPHPDGPYMLLEYMDKGDLSNYLKAMRNASPALTLSQLLQMAVQVAMGCKYLEDLHFVHRDLAARNCLVSSLPSNGAIVKVGDFGLARDIYRNDYYRMEMDGKVPFKWMSPESLMDRTWTTKADVWSFGVLIWEIMSLGQQPYPARTNHEVLQFLKDGGRLEKPENCPDNIYKIMNWCWAFNSEDRPSFAQLVIQLEHLFNQAQRNSGVLRQNRQGSPAGTIDAAVAEVPPPPQGESLAITPAEVSRQSVDGPVAVGGAETAVGDDAKLDEELDERSNGDGTAAAVTHKLRLLTSSPTEDGIVYHVIGDGSLDRRSADDSLPPASLNYQHPPLPHVGHVNPVFPPPATAASSFAYSSSSPRGGGGGGGPPPPLSPASVSGGGGDDDVVEEELEEEEEEENDVVSVRFDSPCTMTSSLLSSLATPPVTPLFQATPPATPGHDSSSSSSFASGSPAVLAAATAASPSSSSSHASNSFPFTSAALTSAASRASLSASLSSLRASKRLSPGLPSLPLSPPPTPLKPLGGGGGGGAPVDVSSVAPWPNSATVRPIGHHSQLVLPSSTLQRNQVPREVKRPRMLLNNNASQQHQLTPSASLRLLGSPRHPPSNAPHSVSPVKHSVGFFEGDVMTTSFPSDKPMKIPHPLQRTFSLEERGGRFRRLYSLNKLLDLKSKTSPAIIPESPPQPARPMKSCLRRGQRTISGGESRDTFPPLRQCSAATFSSSSASTLPISEGSLEETIASDLLPETRKFMLSNPPLRRNNSSTNGSQTQIGKDHDGGGDDGYATGSYVGDEPSSPGRLVHSSWHNSPATSSMAATDCVSIHGAFSSAPVHFFRIADSNNVATAAPDKAQPAAAHRGDFSRPTMTTFGDPGRRQLRQLKPEPLVGGGGGGGGDIIAIANPSLTTTTTTTMSENSSPVEGDFRTEGKNSASLSPPSSSSSSSSSTSKFSFDHLLDTRAFSAGGRTQPTPESLSAKSLSLTSSTSTSSSPSRSLAMSSLHSGGSEVDNSRPMKIVQCRLQRASPPQESHEGRQRQEAALEKTVKRVSPDRHHYQNHLHLNS